MIKRYIIVSGIPASGKSTIARAIAAELGLPLLDKDEILEALFGLKGVGDVEWRKRLSREADAELEKQARESAGAVITSWWRHPASQVDSGTPVKWLASLPGLNVELKCICSPEVAARRFVSRRRHEGHLDEFKVYDDLLASFRQQATLGPLNLGLVLRVNTEDPVALAKVLAEIDFLVESFRQ